MKWLVRTEAVVDLDWDNVEWTPRGAEYLLEVMNSDEERVKDVEWRVFEENWIVDYMLQAKSMAASGDLEGTLYFGFVENGVAAVLDEDDAYLLFVDEIGSLRFTTTEESISDNGLESI